MCPLPPAHTHMGLWISTWRLLCLRITCGQPKAGTLQTAATLPGSRPLNPPPPPSWTSDNELKIQSDIRQDAACNGVYFPHFSSSASAAGATFCNGCFGRKNSYATLILNACLNPWGLYFKKLEYFMVVLTGLQVPLRGFMQKRIRKSYSNWEHNWRC